MFCVIQEIETKKPNKNGYAKKIEISQCGYRSNTEEVTWNTYHYGYEKFERPVKKAYRVSIHHSYRENGKVKKKQFVVRTFNYYSLADDFFGLDEADYDIMAKIAESLNVTTEKVIELVESKLNPLVEKLEKEFQETEEYKTHQEHEKITNEYALKKAQFNAKYGVGGNEYDMCYDVFGNITDQEHLDKIKAEYEQRKEYEERSRSYQKNFYSNYSKYFEGGGSSYHNSISDNYMEEDREILKQFYRSLTKQFHPDANPDADTSKEMQLLNRLKSEWGV